MLCHPLFSLLEISFPPLPPNSSKISHNASIWGSYPLPLPRATTDFFIPYFALKSVKSISNILNKENSNFFYKVLAPSLPLSPTPSLSLFLSPSMTNKMNKCPWLWFLQSFFVFPSLFVQAFLTGEGTEWQKKAQRQQKFKTLQTSCLIFIGFLDDGFHTACHSRSVLRHHLQQHYATNFGGFYL